MFSLIKGSEPFCRPFPHRKMAQIRIFESRSLFSIYIYKFSDYRQYQFHIFVFFTVPYCILSCTAMVILSFSFSWIEFLPACCIISGNQISECSHIYTSDGDYLVFLRVSWLLLSIEGVWGNYFLRGLKEKICFVRDCLYLCVFSCLPVS